VAKIQRGNSLAAREPATVVNTGTPGGKGWDSDGRTDGRVGCWKAFGSDIGANLQPPQPPPQQQQQQQWRRAGAYRLFR